MEIQGGKNMINPDKEIEVANRASSRVIYKIPESGVVRDFAPKQRRRIKFSELELLSFNFGGQNLLRNNLIILDKEAREALVPGTEIEYDYDEADVKRLLFEGSLDEFLDCLDFAPQGVIDLIKDCAVKYELNDNQKRKAILQKTGFNVTNAIVIKETKFDGDDAGAGSDDTESQGRRRRVTQSGEGTAAPGRRVTIIEK